MLNHWQIALAAAAAAAVMFTTIAASPTALAQTYPPTDWPVFRPDPAGAFSQTGIHSTGPRNESSPIVASVPPPGITTVWPANGYNFQPTTITITGTGYVATPAVALGSASLSNVTFINATTITATVPAGLPAGTYTLTVANPDAQSTSLAGAFAVLSSGDASLGAWSTAATMASIRDWPAAVVEGDNLYVLGGASPDLRNPPQTGMLSSAERSRIYSDGSLGSWQSTSSLTVGRAAFGAVAYGNRLYAVGGVTPGWDGLASVEVAAINGDGSLDAWQAAAAMSTGRAGVAAVVSHDNIYAIGGVGGGTFKTSVERAAIGPDGTLGPWQDTSAMTTPRSYLAAVVVGDYVYAIGGQNSTNPAFRTVERAAVNADGSLGAWVAVNSMVNSRCDLAAVASRGYIYAVGGSNCTSTVYPTVERAKVNPDGSLEAWAVISSMSGPRYRAAAVLTRNFLYAIGGEDDNYDGLSTVVRAEVSPFSFASLSPSVVGADLTTDITVQGMNFVPVGTLSLGGAAPLATSFVSTRTVTATVPAGLASGWYTATLTNGDGRTAATSNAVLVDAIPPAGSISAQGWTSPWNPITVTLTLSATDSTSGVSQMAFSTDNQTYSAWEGFGISKVYQAPAGANVVWARFKDQGENLSIPVSATVMLDSVSPTGTLSINGGAYDTTSITVTLALSATDSLSGVADSSYSNDGSAWSAWSTFAASKQWAVTEGDGDKSVWTRFRDAAGNESTPISKTINLDTTVSGISGVSINDGALYTNQVTVTVSLPAPFQATQTIVSNDGAFAGATWEPYAAYKPWAITRYGDYVIPRTVYVKYQDVAGSISGTYQDDIILDVNAPTGSVSIQTGSGGSTAPSDTTLGLSATDLETGVGGMMISSSPTFSGSTWLQFQPSVPWNFGSDSKVYTVFKDNAGNASPVYAAGLSGSKESLPSLVLGTLHPKTGGELASDETKIVASFPPGAVDSKADLTLVPAVESNLETSIGALVESDLGTSTGSLSNPFDRSIAFDYDTGRLGSVGKFLTLTAKARNNPLTSFAKPFRLSIAFDYDTGRAGRDIAFDYDTGRIGRVKASTLAIYSWNGTTWVKEPSSSWNPSTRKVSASINHLSSFAVLGETDNTIYLPLLTKQASGW